MCMQDYGIECPSTKSVFSLKTGEILTWYIAKPIAHLILHSSHNYAVLLIRCSLIDQTYAAVHVTKVVLTKNVHKTVQLHMNGVR